ncbi:MAG: ribosome silencing factor [Candidatus Krumholzibacteria bacterium]|nr:ribosome silencing factor [Candidatus Krumholzibacteria bacterium]
MQPKVLAKRIIRAAWEKKAEEIALLNLKKLSGVTDYFVICSAGSAIQARVIADAVVERLDGTDSVLHVEGYEEGSWILIDCVDVILHVFRPETREYYALEKLWGDAPREEYPDGLQ